MVCIGQSLLFSTGFGALELETVIYLSLVGGVGGGGAHRVSEILILWPPQHYKCGRVEAVVSVQTQWSHAVLCLMMVILQTLAPWITEM